MAVDDEDVVTAERVLVKDKELAAAVEHSAENNGKPLTDEALLALFVSKELSEGTPYACTLPSIQPSGVCMRAEDSDLLPRAYAECAKATRKYAVDQYQACAAALHAVGSLAPDEADFLAAFAHVRARSVEVNDEQGADIEAPSPLLRTGSGRRRALLPAFDLLNHRAGASTHLKREGGLWRVEADDAYAAGEQVFVTYGERDNLKMLLQYGFVLADNDEAIVLFDCRDLVEGCVRARPHLFDEVKEALLEQLTAAQEAAAPEAGGGDGDGAFQRLALFSYDAVNRVPRESLVAALGMMETVLPALGGSEEEATTFVDDALRAMLTARHDELMARLADATQLEGKEQGKATEGSLRDPIMALLRAEQQSLTEILG